MSPPTEKHRKNVYPVEERLEFEIRTAHRIGDRRRKHKRGSRTDDGAPDRYKITPPHLLIRKHDAVIFKRKHARQKVHASFRIIGALIKTSRQHINDGIKAHHAEERHQNKQDHVERFDPMIEFALSETAAEFLFPENEHGDPKPCCAIAGTSKPQNT